MQFALFLCLAIGATFVAAHGHIRQILVNGEYYTTVLPYAKPNYTLPAPSILRRTFGEGPIKTPLLRNITCSETAEPVQVYAPVTAGTNITFLWNGFTHNGPIFTYMSKCANDDCTTYWGDDRDSTGWFKIDQMGYDNVTDDWATEVLFHQNNTWSSTIPECITPGKYLIRHEILSVSEAYKVGGCQFYPSCTQVEVLGSGTTDPAKLVQFPGAYQPNDVGIIFNTNLPYTYYPLPGPELFTCPIT